MLSWAPIPDEVHDLLAVRATTDGFSSETTPTDKQVEAIIGKVAIEVVGVLGDIDMARVINPSAVTLTDRVTVGQIASKVTALGAAAEVERSFFPEQQPDTEAETSLYRQYRESLERLQTLAGSVTGHSPAFVGSAPLRLPAIDYGVALGAEMPIR